MNRGERGGSIEDLKLRGKEKENVRSCEGQDYSYGPDTVWA